MLKHKGCFNVLNFNHLSVTLAYIELLRRKNEIHFIFKKGLILMRNYVNHQQIHRAVLIAIVKNASEIFRQVLSQVAS